MTFDLEIVKVVVPLMAVILTAALSGYVIPLIARRWKDHEKEIEIKISLIESINDCVVRFVLATQFAERGVIKHEDFVVAYRDWQVDSAIIVARVRSYFGDRDISRELSAFVSAVTDFYALTGVHDPVIRKNHIAKLKAFFGSETTDWDLLEDQSRKKSDWMNWFHSWWNVRQKCLSMKDAINDILLTSTIEFRPKR